MTKTVQPRSWVLLNTAGRNLTVNKPQTEDNSSLLLSVFDSLNDLYEKLNRLNYVIQRKCVELNLYHKNTGDFK